MNTYKTTYTAIGAARAVFSLRSIIRVISFTVLAAALCTNSYAGNNSNNNGNGSNGQGRGNNSAAPNGTGNVNLVWDIAGHKSGTNGNKVNGMDAGLVRGSDLTMKGVPAHSGLQGFIGGQKWASGNSIDTGKYFQFSVTPDVGYAATYNSISMSLVRGNWGGGHGAEMWSLYASTNGFSSAGTLLTTWDISHSGIDQQTPVFADLSALGKQKSTVTFRLYGFKDTSQNDYSGLGNVVGGGGPYHVTGTGSNLVVGVTVTPIPEPSVAIILSGILAGSLVCFRELRAQKKEKAGQAQS